MTTDEQAKQTLKNRHQTVVNIRTIREISNQGMREMATDEQATQTLNKDV